MAGRNEKKDVDCLMADDPIKMAEPFRRLRLSFRADRDASGGSSSVGQWNFA